MKKKELGQFYTRKNIWFNEPVKEFLKDNMKSNNIILDPFAGEGDILNFLKKYLNKNYHNLEFQGLDIDDNFTNWKTKDSLKEIICQKNQSYFLATNPPYLSKNSCRKKKYEQIYEKYFQNSLHSDLYLIALEKMIITQQPGLAIVPETFINSKFKKNNINRIVIIESNPFEDTTIPICVVCFNGQKNEQQIIYKNDKKIGLLKELLKFKNFIKIQNNFLKSLKFNDILGSIALLGVDSTNPQKKIKFLNKANLSYDLKNVKISSRAITVINSDILNTLTSQKITQTIEIANKILNDFRQKTEDVLLTPFKGNNSLNQRRRRLDFTLARKMITQAFLEVENLNS